MKRLWERLKWLSAMLVLLVVTLHVTPLIPWIALRLSDRWEEPKGDVLIVLGADMLGDGTLGVGSYWRSVYGIRAWRNGGFQKMVICGGGPHSMAAEMARFIAAFDVPRERMVLEERSNSTRENAMFAAELLRDVPGVKVLVTSDFHMWRARRVFAKAGIDVKPVPFPDVMKRWNTFTSRWECIWVIGGELQKIIYYWARGWI